MDGRGSAAEPAASLIEISRVLEETARIVREHAEASPDARPRRPALGITAPKVRAILALRRMRQEYLGFDMTDAVWSMLLELYAARLEGTLVHQTRLGVAAGVPQTTALNIARRMLEARIFTRSEHPEDKRLLVLGLSDNAADRIAAYLRAADQVAPLFA